MLAAKNLFKIRICEKVLLRRKIEDLHEKCFTSIRTDLSFYLIRLKQKMFLNSLKSEYIKGSVCRFRE